MINNIENYQHVVRQKMKLFVEKNKVPESVEDTIFFGQYSHTNTLNAILDFIEYVVIQSQNEVEEVV